MPTKDTVFTIFGFPDRGMIANGLVAKLWELAQSGVTSGYIAAVDLTTGDVSKLVYAWINAEQNYDAMTKRADHAQHRADQLMNWWTGVKQQLEQLQKHLQSTLADAGMEAPENLVQSVHELVVQRDSALHLMNDTRFHELRGRIAELTATLAAERLVTKRLETFESAVDVLLRAAGNDYPLGLAGVNDLVQQRDGHCHALDEKDQEIAELREQVRHMNQVIETQNASLDELRAEAEAMDKLDWHA